MGEVLNLGLDFASTTIGCGTQAGGSLAKLMESFGGSVLDFFLQQRGNLGTVGNCASAVSDLSSGGCNPPGSSTDRTFPMRKSIDPNAKGGPAGGGPLRYIEKNEQLVYTTEFENLATATAPAITVTVTDTLDKGVMDLSTFRFNGVTIAGATDAVFSNTDSFAMDLLMTNPAIVVRATGRLDTTSGVATWQFKSFDPATMDLVGDIDPGFLPPNVDGITGTGSVTYSVRQKPTNTHLTTISNKTSIVFDRNEPIVTPVWTNVVDTVKPQSRMLAGSVHRLTDSSFRLNGKAPPNMPVCSIIKLPYP